MWKKSLTRLAKPVLKTPSIAAVELTIEGGPLLVVSVYMPCRGYSDSDMQFRRVLDQLHQLLEDNVNTPTIIGGDWNASRVRDPPLPRDGVFSQFITQAKLTLLPLPPDVSTFLHHNGKDSSQIDYILIRDIPASQNPRVLVPPLGTSDHHVVVATVEAPIYPHPTPRATPHTGPTPYPKIKWEKVDLSVYRDNISVPPLQDTFTETLTALMDLAKSLRLASEIASPCHTSQQKKFRMTSPDIKAAALAKRESYLKWKEAGSPKGSSVERDEMTRHKSLLRKALKQEFRRREDEKVNKINTARQDNRALMFRLIKPSSSRAETDILRYEGQTYTTPDGIRSAWKEHYEAQVTPKPRCDDYFKAVETDYQFLSHIALQSTLPPVQASYRDIIMAVQSLNPKKAPDALGIQAEHLRYSGPETLTFIMVAPVFTKTSHLLWNQQTTEASQSPWS